ncbi:Intradiol ring-cleavage dioxygenase [Xylariaceae sp. FL0016]|nr:Intradiol ring-cleavage dioxygenase [Xylariaceae sp. FL0016]
MLFNTIATVALAATSVHAHGNLKREIAMRSAMLEHTSRDLSHCSSKLKARGFEERAVQRRSETLNQLLKKRNIKTRRSVESVLATDHNETASGYTMGTPENVIFASNGSCTLTPEGESGPYYVAGEYIRTDLAEDVEGIPVHYEFQILDVDTCEPIVGSYFEIFNANSTGVYSGTTNTNNGNTNDTSVLNETWLRGLQPTDDEGVVNFDTVFPGHYDGRATHIHTLLHGSNATARANGTVLDTSFTHIGQTFWDQSVRDLVEQTYPYSTNTKALTTNADDFVFLVEAPTSDPVFRYVQLGETIEDGFLAWMVLAVNRTLSTTVDPAAVYYETGGVELEHSSLM